MAKVAFQNNYSRPQLHTNRMHEIIDCRHPLMELLVPGQYQTNNYFSGGDSSRVQIITGPNGSGKSVYLKQIAIIVYLAHVGFYVPAKSAYIGVVSSIHSRMQATESATVRLSSFMIDLSQITQAFYNSNPSSLILIDEFGRGTTGNEGLAILSGVVQEFLGRGDDCPHILVSTHYQYLVKLVPESPFVAHLKMNYAIEDEELVFLYKITHGVSDSFGLEIARSVGLDADIIERAKQIYDEFINNPSITQD